MSYSNLSILSQLRYVRLKIADESTKVSGLGEGIDDYGTDG
jgi:hypothetical protein